jgi:hypothetical protein
MRKRLQVRAASVPAAGWLNHSTALVCLSLMLAMAMLAARIASLW